MSPRAVPELLAQAAVDHFGDSTDRYLRWLRATYPEATPDGLARLVTQRLTRRYPYTLYAGPLALLVTQAQLVLHIAGAYGRDPRDPQRADELLTLIDARPLVAPVLGRLTGRLLPGAGLVLGALAHASALDQTARRANAYYKTNAHYRDK